MKYKPNDILECVEIFSTSSSYIDIKSNIQHIARVICEDDVYKIDFVGDEKLYIKQIFVNNEVIYHGTIPISKELVYKYFKCNRIERLKKLKKLNNLNNK